MPRPKQTHCKRGHLRSPENLYKHGGCKLCYSERETKCSECKQIKVIGGGYCKDCYNKYARKKGKGYQRDKYLKWKYNITSKDIPKVCDICGKAPYKQREHYIVPDHCHDTGDLRGFLCNRCNHVLGMVKDNAELINKIYEYIIKHSLNK